MGGDAGPRRDRGAARLVVDVLLDDTVVHGAGTVGLLVRDVGATVAIDVTDEGAGPGHGIGLATSYEWPSLDTEHAPLEPGMTICIEPGVYAPGIGNMKLEDDFVITGEGCEVLTTSEASLEVPA